MIAELMPDAKDAAPDGEQWLTAQQAMRYLSVSRMTLYRYVRAGKVKAHELPNARAWGRGDLRFKRSDLDALLRPVAPDEDAGAAP